MRKLDEQPQSGPPIILRLRARWHAVDLRVHGLFNCNWYVIGLQFERSGRI